MLDRPATISLICSLCFLRLAYWATLMILAAGAAAEAGLSQKILNQFSGFAPLAFSTAQPNLALCSAIIFTSFVFECTVIRSLWRMKRHGLYLFTCLWLMHAHHGYSASQGYTVKVSVALVFVIICWFHFPEMTKLKLGRPQRRSRQNTGNHAGIINRDASKELLFK